eukprot:474560-Rhodomonas_salina.1
MRMLPSSTQNTSLPHNAVSAQTRGPGDQRALEDERARIPKQTVHALHKVRDPDANKSAPGSDRPDLSTRR